MSAVARDYEGRLLDESEQTARARHEFLMTASHELKTPITSVKLAAQLLKMRRLLFDSLARSTKGLTTWHAE